MRVFILQNCVVAGSVWFGGEEVMVDEAVGYEMVERGYGKEMQEYHRGDAENAESLGVEIRVLKANERAVGSRERGRHGA